MDGVGRKSFFNDFTLSSGSIEWLKWVGVVSMAIDHINYFCFERQYAFMFNIGRIAFPLFVMLVAYNFAKHPSGVHVLFKKSWGKLLVSGLFAVPAIALFSAAKTVGFEEWLSKDWYLNIYSLFPLNIMFSFLCLAFLIVIADEFIEKQKWTLIAPIIFVTLSFVGEYGVSTLFIGLGFYLLVRYKDLEYKIIGLAFFVIGFVILILVHSLGFYPLMALPLIYIASRKSFNIPRLRYFFYVFYPLHINIIIFAWYMQRIL